MSKTIKGVNSEVKQLYSWNYTRIALTHSLTHSEQLQVEQYVYLTDEILAPLLYSLTRSLITAYTHHPSRQTNRHCTSKLTAGQILTCTKAPLNHIITMIGRLPPPPHRNKTSANRFIFTGGLGFHLC